MSNQEIITYLKELIDIADKNEEQYLEYHKDKYTQTWLDMGYDYYPPVSPYASMVGELKGGMEFLVGKLEREEEKKNDDLRDNK